MHDRNKMKREQTELRRDTDYKSGHPARSPRALGIAGRYAAESERYVSYIVIKFSNNIYTYAYTN